MKQYFLIFLAALGMLMACPSQASAEIIIYQGDMNDDGVYSIGDLAQVINIINHPADEYPVAADVNGDNVVDENDVLMLRDFILQQVVPGSRGKVVSPDRSSEVEWYQLWKHGPRWALYNVGATQVTEVGNLYKWGALLPGDEGTAYTETQGIQYTDYDTAKKVWNDGWMMPETDEYEALGDNTSMVYTTDYVGDKSNIKGFIFTGLGDYACNSVFFPIQGTNSGYYWTAGVMASPTGTYSPVYTCLMTTGPHFFMSSAAKTRYVRAVVYENDDFIVHPGEEANPEVGAGVKGQNF